MKKIGLLFSILALVLSSTQAIAADSATIRIAETHEGLSLSKSHQSFIAYGETKQVKLQNQTVEMTNAAGFCNSPADANCQKKGWGAYSVLPACDDGKEPYCVEGISFAGNKATLVGYTPGMRVKRDPNFLMATGASTSIWQVRDRSGSLQNISAKVSITSGSADVITDTGLTFVFIGSEQFFRINIELNRVEITNEDYKAPDFVFVKDFYGINQITLIEEQSKLHCYVEYKGKCVRTINKIGEEMAIDLRISDLPASWFTGRLSKASVSISTNTSNQRVLSVAGESVSVPEIKTSVSKLDLSRDNPFLARGPVGDYYSQTATNGLQFFSALDEKYINRATSSNVYWSLSAPLGRNAGPCFERYPGVGGFSTTNALVYNLANPVVFEGEMIYLIGSTHLDENGVENRGTYDLVLRSDIARCLYGLNSAPVKAEISVVSEDGQRQVATTTFGEKNGWLRVGAYNFTFSTPKIKVKLTQATKKATIICVKGKVKKSVSGAKPACPTGFKKAG